ncbi:hypothetical protein E4U54_006029, partial [Claviceps lovelessii]
MDSSNGLGKLFSKSITSKRRRRKDKTDASGHHDDARSSSANSSKRRFQHQLALEGDDVTSSNLADDDVDDRSFVGSFESAPVRDPDPDPDQDQTDR